MQLPKIEMHIVFDPNTNSVQLSGPINNLAIVYSVLELAKDAAREHVKLEQSKVARPNPGELVEFGRR